MRTHARAYWAPKDGSSDAEYQDSFYFDQSGDGYSTAATQRFAISDGATEAIFSGAWARLLAQAWGCSRLDCSESQQAQLASLSQEWADANPNGSLPWWAEQKMLMGSFSTLLGLELMEHCGRVRWSIQAVGDSCFFLVDQDTVVCHGPVGFSDQFVAAPFLIATNAEYNKSLSKNVVSRSGVGGQEFLLMTDALACWFLKGLERGERPSTLLGPIDLNQESGEAFHELVRQTRSAGEMRNDDVTLLSVVVLDL